MPFGLNSDIADFFRKVIKNVSWLWLLNEVFTVANAVLNQELLSPYREVSFLSRRTANLFRTVKLECKNLHEVRKNEEQMSQEWSMLAFYCTAKFGRLVVDIIFVYPLRLGNRQFWANLQSLPSILSYRSMTRIIASARYVLVLNAKVNIFWSAVAKGFAGGR